MYFGIMCSCHPFIDSSIYGSKSQYLILALHKENTILLKKKYQLILPKNMLVSLVIQKSFVSDVYMDDISGIKYQPYHLHLEQYFIQQRHDQNFQHLC